MKSKVKVLVTQSCPTLCDPMDHSPPGPTDHEILQARILDSYSLLPGLFLTQGSNPGPLHCRQILYHLSHQGSPVLTNKEVQSREVRFIAQSPKASQSRADYLEIHIYIYVSSVNHLFIFHAFYFYSTFNY